MKKRVLSMIMVLTMIVSMLPGAAFAAEVDESLCAHHTEHTADCGYVAAVAEVPCGHEHTGECYTAGVLPDADSGDAYEVGEDVNALDCQHVHDSECGYVEAVEASPCTYECVLCGLTEITAWSWIDDWEMIDPDTGVLALPGASADNPAYFDDIVSMLPVEITATVDGNEETVALDGWACPGYPEEGAYSGNYIFTAALPEGYTLAEDAPELTVTVELGGAALFATDVTKYGLTISGGTEGTDFTYDHEFRASDGGMVSLSTYQRVLTILKDTDLTISGEGWDSATLTAKNIPTDYGEVVYIPSGVTANLTLDGATIYGGRYTPSITVDGTLNLTLKGENKLDPYFDGRPGIWVLEDGNLIITEESTGNLKIIVDGSGAAIGQDNSAASAGFDDGGVNKAGNITINGGTLNLSAGSGAAIGSAHGSNFTSITINGGVIDAASSEGAAIGTGFNNSTTSQGTVKITGGTINASGGTTTVGSTIYKSDGVGSSDEPLTGGVTITGGSVKNTALINRPTDGTNALYLATITLNSDSGGTAVSDVKYYLNGMEKSYSVSNMQTMEGKLYLWLPEGAVVSSVTADGKNYTGNLLVRDDDSAEGTFYTGTTYTVSLAENSNVTDSLPYGNTFAAGATVYVQVDADEGYAVTGVDTTENPSSYTWVDGNIYSFIMPANAATVYVTAQQVALPDTLDLSYGDITFGYDADKNCRYLTYYTSDGTTKTVNYIPAGQTYTITQSNSSAESTANTIKVENWDKFTGDELPLKLTISNLNINADTGAEGSESLSENLIAINSSTVELTLVGTSTLTSSVTTAANREVALLGVDGTSELTITQGSNGSLTSTAAGGRGAAIGGDCVGDTGDGVACGIINIKGGTIAAVIGDEEDGRVGYGAAIGSGRIGTGGTVNISGGEVTATSHGAGAAIGSGTLGTAFTVNVSGGKVIARNTYGSSGGGAAIGSGSNGAAYVIISGGEVEATAFRGAAIGSGDSGDATVAISDGTVIAHAAGSYAYGAGIGSGAYGEATVTISGGSITASTGGTSGTYAAAIGGGGSGNSSTSNATVTITGGDINATGSSYTPAIGSGYSGSSNANATVSISGGNINVDNDTVATIGLGGGNNSTATVTITGGSVNGKKRTTTTSFTDGNSNEVYLITATLSDADAAVTGSITGENYSFNGVKTNSEGKIFLWLPESSESDPTKATFNGGSYTGMVKTSNDSEFVSDKPSPTVTAPTANTLTYDGTAQALVTAGSTTGGTLQYALGTDGTNAPADGWGTTAPTGTDAKDYYVWYRVLDDDQYAGIAATCVPVTIAKRAITVKADDQTVLPNNQPDSSKISVTSGTLVDGHTLTATLETVSDVTTLGTYPGALKIDTFTIKSGDTDVSNNYNVTPATGNLTVANHTHSWSYELTTTNTTDDTIKATCSSEFGTCPANKTATITLNKPARTTYGGVESAAATTTVEPTGALTAPTEISYTGTTNGGVSYNSTTAPTDAGTYTASITVGGVTAQVEYTITAKTLPAATLSAASGNYNGSAHAPTVTVDGLTQGTDYTVSFPADMTSSGEKTITVAGMGNYTGTQTLTYTINPIAPTAADFSFTEPDSLTYSGTAKAAIVAPAKGITGMGAVTVKYSADPVNVGEYTVSIDVAAGDNYTATTGLTADAWKFSITKALLTVTADNKTMTTGQALPTFTYTITGFVNGEDESVLTTKPTASTGTDGKTKGEYDITVSGAADDNYDFTYEKGTLSVVDHQHNWTYTAENGTITAKCGNEDTCPNKEQSITISAVGKTYNGTAVEAKLDGSIDGVDKPEITYCCEGGCKDAKTHTASIKLGNAEAKAEFTITAATPVIAWESTTAAVNYAGSEAVITAPTVTLVNSETFNGTISYSYTGTSSGNGLPINAGTYEITASVEAQGNYTAATSTNKLTLTINKIASSCTAPAAVSGLTFNGGDQNLVTAGTATGGTMQYSLDNSNWSATIPTGKDAGSYTVYYKVVGDSNHNDNAGGSVSVAIAPKTVTTPTIEGIEAQYLHTGSAITPVPTAVKDGNTVIDPSEYTVAYENNTDEGTATVKIVDAVNGNYTVSGSTTFKIVVHEHDWKYSANGDTITAVCEGTTGTCPVANKTVTIALAAPAGDALTYKESEEKTVTVTQTPADIFALPNVVYNGDRTNVGSVTASLTYGGVTASVSFTITKADQLAPSGLDKTNESIKGKNDGAITDVTNKMEYATSENGSYTAITGTTLNDLADGTYYVRYAADANHNASPAVSLTIAEGAAITVTFNSNGQEADGMPGQQTGLSYGDKVSKPADPTATDSDYAFVGWYKDSAGMTAWNFATDSLTEKDVTIYAVWKQVYFSVTATINDHQGNPYTGNVTVKLMRGSNTMDTVTGTNGTFTFSKHVETGMYNLVAVYTDSTGEHTKTELITVDHDDTYTLQLPEPGVNSHLDVSSNAETPAVMVGGLDKEAASVKTAAPSSDTVKEVSVTMDVEGKKETQINNEVVQKIEEAIIGGSGTDVSAVVEYLEIEVKKEVVTNSGTTTTPITQTANVIEIVIPFSFTGRTGIKIIRHHDDAAAVLVENDTKGDGTFYLDRENGYIHIFTQKFSTYAVSYTTSYTVSFDVNGGDGSNSSATTAPDGTVSLPSDPTRSGYTFKGWYTALSGGTKVTSDYVFSGDTTVYAQWTQNYSGGGGYVPSTYPITVEDVTNGTVKADRVHSSYGTTVTLTVTPDEGYKLGSLTVTDANGKKIEVTDKGDGKYTFKMPSGKVTVEASFVSDASNIPCDGGANCPSKAFTDLDTGAWYHEAVDYALTNSLMNGVGNGKFDPNGTTSRAMIVTILWRLEGEPVANYLMQFEDVPTDTWYTGAVRWAASEKIVEGYSDTAFGPNDPITREQFATILWRYAKYKGYDVSVGKDTNILSYEDAFGISEWAIPAMQWACGTGLMQGDGVNLTPKADATRVQAAALFQRFCENVAKK